MKFFFNVNSGEQEKKEGFMNHLIEKREDNVVSASLFHETEGKKQAHIREHLKNLIKEAHKKDDYCLKLPYFVILAFLKFTPEHMRLRYSKKDNEYQLFAHRFNYIVRATVPDPLWGTHAYLVKTGTEEYAHIWSLPHLARRSPQYTLQRSIKAGRCPFEIGCIVGMINGDLHRLAREHNFSDKIEKPIEAAIKNGTIPLVKAGTISEPYIFSPSSSRFSIDLC